MSYDYVLEEKAKEIGIKNFIGCKMRDQFKNKKCSKTECGIVNLQTTHDVGSHWCCYYRNDNTKIWFDSYGLDPPLELQKYLGKHIEVFCSYDGNTPDQPLQSFHSKICGELCLIVLWLLNNNYEFSDVLNILDNARSLH